MHDPVLVTGAASGIGQAVLRRILMKPGGVAIGLDRKGPNGESGRDTLLSWIGVDIADPNASQVIARSLPEPLFAVVHCAAVMPWQAHKPGRVLETNVGGTFSILDATIPRLANGGRLILLSSVAALRAAWHPDWDGHLAWPKHDLKHLLQLLEGHAYDTSEAYALSKRLLLSLQPVLGARLFDRRITVNVLLLGPTDTNARDGLAETEWQTFLKQVPLGAPNKAEDVAHLITDLLSNHWGMVTGGVIPVDGGQSLRTRRASDVPN